MQKRAPVAFPAARDSSSMSAVTKAVGFRVVMALIWELMASIRDMNVETILRQDVKPL